MENSTEPDVEPKTAEASKPAEYDSGEALKAYVGSRRAVKKGDPLVVLDIDAYYQDRENVKPYDPAARTVLPVK